MSTEKPNPKEPEQPPEEISPEARRKAERAIWILYLVMAIGVLLPFVLLFFFGRD